MTSTTKRARHSWLHDQHLSIENTASRSDGHDEERSETRPAGVLKSVQKRGDTLSDVPDQIRKVIERIHRKLVEHGTSVSPAEGETLWKSEGEW